MTTTTTSAHTSTSMSPPASTTGGTTRSRPERVQVREALLDAAGEEFLAHGYQGTTVTRIAQRAGFTKGAAYSNFGGKAELLAAACLRRWSATTEGVVGDVAMLGDDRSPDAIGRRLTRAVIESSQWSQTLAEVASVARHDPETASAYRQIREAQLEQMVAEIGRLDLGLSGSVESTARLLQATMSHLGFERAVVPDRWPDSVIASTLTALMRGLLA
ncbi:TetR/AcrR family transcriptional regulator [Aestuariimicrobium sp. T2.26MG-19.2B]|uniref:TetR/AcrR family transcriptional regulator n=1 Tax=Aestuariimicrobium sp. T2.26MG-19.2B TaxID=3040679 RepID=UPI002477B3A7|nr:TetR/AcrR family transcriptional regulator [Aestuariimicrobium sp. T2.26MG-19.2B]CAI9409409.1 hypothetical protein AESSP_02229 [Aestuariimicrobium sp. T2.26MG-19.2B]